MNARQLQRNKHLLSMTGGRCYYCAYPLHVDEPRDWIVIGVCRDFVREHKMPVQRGGKNEIGNYVPSCWNCNGVKSSFTITEFRFLQGLRQKTLNFVFPFERPRSEQRDWLCVNSPSFEKKLMVLNFPLAASRYQSRAGFLPGTGSSHWRK